MNGSPESCESVAEELSALIDAELPAEREAAVRAHLAGCPRCSGELEALCRVDLALASLPAPGVPHELRERIGARLAAAAAAPEAAAASRGAAAAPPRRARRWLAGPALAAAALAAAVALAVLWASPRGGLELPVEGVARAPVPAPAAGAQVAPAAGARAAPDGAESIARAPAPPRRSPGPRPPPASADERLAAAEPPAPARLDELPDAELGLLLELDSVEDLDVIANLDLLEGLVALDQGAG